jgi:hypothetical protein
MPLKAVAEAAETSEATAMKTAKWVRLQLFGGKVTSKVAVDNDNEPIAAWDGWIGVRFCTHAPLDGLRSTPTSVP